MLSRLYIENFLSFKGKHEISFNHDSSNARIFKNNILFEYKEFGRKRVILNGLLVLGANASGKSNIVNAMSFMKSIYLKSFDYNTLSDINSIVKEFLFKERSEESIPTTLGIETIQSVNNNNYKINYEIKIDSKTQKIVYETLSYSEILKTTVASSINIFVRKNGKINHFSSNIKQIIKKIEQDNIEYKSLLSLLNFDLNKDFFKEEMDSIEYEIAQQFGFFLSDNFFTVDSTPRHDVFPEKLLENPEFKEYILESLHDFDFSISDFSIQDMSLDFSEALENHKLMNDLPDFLRIQVINDLKRQNQYIVHAIHKIDNIEYPLSLGSESNGTRKFLKNSFDIYEALFSEKLYVSDEFDSKYHFNIQKGIINKFINNYYENGKKSQFLIVSHNPLLLNPQYFAKEQVLFVEKERDTQESIIYPLSDFKEITYNNHNWANMYLEGRLGAIPEVII